MAFRIGEVVVHGEIINDKHNSVHGWLSFNEEKGLHLELTGNLEGDLAGKHIKFVVPHPQPPPAELKAEAETLSLHQIGVVGNMQLRMVKVPTVPIEEFLKLSRQDGPLPVVEKPCLYLEWYSQNGRVVAEMVDVEFVPVTEEESQPPTPEPLPEDTGSGPQITAIVENENGGYDEVPYTDEDTGADADDEDNDDPYGLFPAGLDDELHDPETDAIDEAAEENADDEAPPEPRRRRSWDEVIPDIDPETKALYEQWDEVIYGDKNEPFATLFDPPIVLKPPAEIESEDEAQTYLFSLLQRLALYSVSVHMCEHYTYRETYRWLLEDILPESGVHPQLASTGWVQGYSTGESCPQCEAEFDAEYDEMERRKREEGEGKGEE